MYCVNFCDRLRESLDFLNQPRIRLRQGYGVTGDADFTDRGNGKISDEPPAGECVQLP